MLRLCASLVSIALLYAVSASGAAFVAPGGIGAGGCEKQIVTLDVCSKGSPAAAGLAPALVEPAYLVFPCPYAVPRTAGRTAAEIAAFPTPIDKPPAR